MLLDVVLDAATALSTTVTVRVCASECDRRSFTTPASPAEKV